MAFPAFSQVLQSSMSWGLGCWMWEVFGDVTFGGDGYETPIPATIGSFGSMYLGELA